MKATLFALRSFGRELRSGEVLVLLAAVGLAVAALTAVGFLTDRIGKAVARQANEVLAADLRLRSQAPVPDEWREIAAEFDLPGGAVRSSTANVSIRTLGAPERADEVRRIVVKAGDGGTQPAQLPAPILEHTLR